jgi:hypothetical protein
LLPAKSLIFRSPFPVGGAGFFVSFTVAKKCIDDIQFAKETTPLNVAIRGCPERARGAVPAISTSVKP